MMQILVARDEAFNFTYQANLDALARCGEVRFFSPLHDEVLPAGDLLYLPGGYPELFAQELSSNRSMRHAIRSFAEKGGRIFAECGGFMYLCTAIDGVPMCDVLPLRTTMEGARLHLGYRQMVWHGCAVRGHEFHYSRLISEEVPASVQVHRLQQTATGRPVDTPLYVCGGVVAGYTHWYWAEQDFMQLWYDV